VGRGGGRAEVRSWPLLTPHKKQNLIDHVKDGIVSGIFRDGQSMKGCKRSRRKRSGNKKNGDNFKLDQWG
jgi:hypothetical protein